jgi:hypothetical protein
MNSDKFKRQTFAWLNQMKARVRDGFYPPTAFMIAYELATQHFNEECGGAAWPGCKTLGDAIGKSEATVIGLIRRMEAGGDLRVEWGSQGRGHSNRYWMVLKPQPAEVLRAEKTSKPTAGKPQFSARKPQLAKENHLKKNHLREDIYPPAADRDRGAPDQPDATAAPLIDDPPASDFAAFWNAYPLHKGQLAARRAFDRAIRRASPAEIVAGAERYAAERAGLDPRFTKHPANWLAAGCWTDEPPPHAGGPPPIDQWGNVVPDHWQRPRSYAEAARRMAGHEYH